MNEVLFVRLVFILQNNQQQQQLKMFGKIAFSDGGSASKTNNMFNKPTNPQNKNSQRKSSDEKKIHPTHKTKMIKKEERGEKKDDFKKKFEDLQGAKFRILNELLYTRPSEESKSYFIQNTQDFQLYHEGYRHQTTKWKYRPVDEIIQFIISNKDNYSKKKIVDLGCGEGFLYEELVKKGFHPNRILSYDLVSIKPFITAADIANLPTKEESADLCVFCLSLMGTNYLSFIREAYRILKRQGQLIISEVESRSPNWKKFVELIEAIGFKLVNNGLQLLPTFQKEKGQSKESRFFRTMLFRKDSSKGKRETIKYEGECYGIDVFSTMILLSCKYKKR